MAQVDQFMSVTEAKNKLLDLIRNIKQRDQVVAITRDGVPTAVLLSMDQFEDSRRPSKSSAMPDRCGR